MSVKLDLTVIASELLDSVVCMDNSPAYDAFKTEIEAILADFNKNSHFGSSVIIDEKALTEAMYETMRNMHEAFFLWLMRDELDNGRSIDTGYSTYLKLFFKANCDKLASLNGGNATVDIKDIVSLKEHFIEEISSDAELYKSIKDFFSGYVYGYFFNYLTEQTVMVKYAEMVVCLGIMTGKITSTVSLQQKMMPKMAVLLSSDRLKYISGFIPLDIMMNIVYSRFAFPTLSDEEMEETRGRIKDFVTSNYEMQTDDESTELVSARTVTDVMSKLHSSYVDSEVSTAEIYEKCFSGVRIFLDGDKDDTGKYDKAEIKSLIDEKCTAEKIDYFTVDREPNLDVALESGLIGYKYPMIYKDGGEYHYSMLYKKLVDKLLENKIYSELNTDCIPFKEFSFADEVMQTNPLRELNGNDDKSYTIRNDKSEYFENISLIFKNKMLSETDRRMLMLEQLLYIMSGNCSAEKYSSMINENIFGTRLYEEYIRFRMNRLCDKGMESFETKKNLLDEINKIG